jgi:hypothetical protein
MIKENIGPMQILEEESRKNKILYIGVVYHTEKKRQAY